MNMPFYIDALIPLIFTSIILWLLSIKKQDVSIVDSVWSIFFIIAGTYVFINTDNISARAIIVLSLVIIWGTRLSAYITIRHWGHDEDHRYQQIRERNQPGFKYKSLYLIFIFQATVAWLVSIPILYAIDSTQDISYLDWIGIILWSAGMYYESISDYQLWKFKRNPDNKGKLLTTGLWAQTRHPNYFGEFLISWGYFCFAAATEAYLTIFAPIIMTFLLMKFSGAELLEKTMKHRDGYSEYMNRTNAFFPGLKNIGKENEYNT